MCVCVCVYICIYIYIYMRSKQSECKAAKAFRKFHSVLETFRRRTYIRANAEKKVIPSPAELYLFEVAERSLSACYPRVNDTRAGRWDNVKLHALKRKRSTSHFGHSLFSIAVLYSFLTTHQLLADCRIGYHVCG